MLRAAWAALLLLPSLAAAFGGSQVTWLGGTLPFDTIPKLEADPKLLLRSGSGGPELGAELGAGITDRLMVAGQWVGMPDGGSDGRAEARLKLIPETWHGLGFCAAGGARLPEGGAAVGYGTLIVGWEGFDSCLTANGTLLSGGGQELAVAAWGPYLTYFVRPGVEVGQSGGPEGRWILPQLAFNLPGDLSIDLGSRFSLDGGGAWRVHARLSYELFPNP